MAGQPRCIPFFENCSAPAVLGGVGQALPTMGPCPACLRRPPFQWHLQTTTLSCLSFYRKTAPPQSETYGLSPSDPAYLSRIFFHLTFLLTPHTILQSRQTPSIRGTCRLCHASEPSRMLFSVPGCVLLLCFQTSRPQIQISPPL